MKWLRIKTLQKRLVPFLMLPSMLILLAGGFVGFLYARQELLRQWREKSTLELERAAHSMKGIGTPVKLMVVDQPGDDRND